MPQTNEAIIGETLVSFLRMQGYRYAEYIEENNHINIGNNIGKTNRFVKLVYENGRFHVMTEMSHLFTMDETKQMSEELHYVTGLFDMITKIAGTKGSYLYV